MEADQPKAYSPWLHMLHSGKLYFIVSMPICSLRAELEEK